VSPIIDIFFPINGVVLTLFQLFQTSILFHNDNMKVQLAVWRFGIALTFVKSEENLCRETQEVKKQ